MFLHPAPDFYIVYIVFTLCIVWHLIFLCSQLYIFGAYSFVAIMSVISNFLDMHGLCSLKVHYVRSKDMSKKKKHLLHDRLTVVFYYVHVHKVVSTCTQGSVYMYTGKCLHVHRIVSSWTLHSNHNNIYWLSLTFCPFINLLVHYLNSSPTGPTTFRHQIVSDVKLRWCITIHFAVY